MWTKVAVMLPPERVLVETKIHDDEGCRNLTKLRYRKGLWFVEDESVYVYYTPTHWR